MENNLGPFISAVAPEHVHALLTSTSWDSDAGILAIQVVKSQLTHVETPRNRRVRKDAKLPSLLDAATDKLVTSIDAEDAEEYIKSMEGLPQNVLRRVALRLENMPYHMFCNLARPGEDGGDVDEWVLRNEVWLRETFGQQTRVNAVPSRSVHGDSAQNFQRTCNWAHGLVRLSMHTDVVFPGSMLTNSCRIIVRPTSLPGFTILDARRLPVIRIQPSVEAFRNSFDAMTGGVLKNLDWDNVLVAGGIVLGSLLCTENPETVNTPEQWTTSDIDLYIYGLGPVEANKKMEHILSVFKTNLGEDAPVLAVRNSKTITFFSKYPTRRVQIVLKLVDSPKDVLLNFDLDVCAVGWDGEEVWMLPRAARALETGYTVFTMDLINGHYLGDRRATQEQRLFKYADKGFGIRILPSYLDALPGIVNDPEKQRALGIDPNQCTSWNFQRWDLQDFDRLVDDARNWTTTVIKALSESTRPVPIISHSLLQERLQITEDPPRRSVLSGLSLFMRHVVLWECQVAGAVIIKKEGWAAQLYDHLYSDQFGVSYNDAPNYPWDSSFTHEGFINNIASFNLRECHGATEAILRVFDGCSYSYPDYIFAQPFPLASGPHTIQRMSHATSVAEILAPECDIYLPVWLPKNFIDFAEDLISRAVRESAAIPGYAAKAFTEALKDDLPASRVDSEGLRLIIWRTNCITMWQQLDRTIDVVHEVLWAFRLANVGFLLAKEDRLKLLAGEFARRAIRMTAQDEYGAFARWVARKPVGYTNYSESFTDILDNPSDYV